MSMKGISSSTEPDKFSRRISLTHNKRNSCELDVFEAAVYFSGYNEPSSSDTQKYGYNGAREENRRRWGVLGGGRRISLDLPIRCSEQVHHLYQDHHEVTKERLGNVRYKQPSSPGGKIASFLSSLFHQARSKKNKSKTKSKPTDPEVEEEVSGVGWMRRRRRSSISQFLSSSKSNTTTTFTTSSSSSSKSVILSSSSGFRTPPPYLNTPTKNYKQFLNYTSATKQVGEEEKKINKEFSWLESLSENKRVWADEDRRIKREEDDDGMESDSSSDLFELQNYELSRGGLPVYETTNVANINNTHI